MGRLKTSRASTWSSRAEGEQNIQCQSHHPSSIIHHPLSIIHHPSSIIHHPSSIIHHPSSILVSSIIKDSSPPAPSSREGCFVLFLRETFFKKRPFFCCSSLFDVWCTMVIYSCRESQPAPTDSLYGSLSCAMISNRGPLSCTRGCGGT